MSLGGFSVLLWAVPVWNWFWLYFSVASICREEWSLISGFPRSYSQASEHSETTTVACEQVFCESENEEATTHIRHITLRGDHNNNKMERMNGEIRDREKTMRGLKRKRTPILQGYQIYHNFIREHESLKRKNTSRSMRNQDWGQQQVENSDSKRF